MAGRFLGAAALAAALLAVACGDGGSRSPQDGSPDTTAPAVASSTPGAGATGVPRSTRIDVVFTEPVSAATVTAETLRVARGRTPLAHCLADFDGDGDTDAVVAPGDGSASPMAVEYYASDGGALAHQAGALAAPVPGLVHARKCVVLDATATAGSTPSSPGTYDQPPFPGEAPVLLVNRAGGFAAAALPPGAAGFNHGAATGDVDEDGDGDVFVARQGNPYFLVNDGHGAFALDTARVPSSLRGNVYTSELVDVDGDSYLDLLAAGHEQDGLSSAVFWGDGTGRYSDAGSGVFSP